MNRVLQSLRNDLRQKDLEITELKAKLAVYENVEVPGPRSEEEEAETLEDGEKIEPFDANTKGF